MGRAGIAEIRSFFKRLPGPLISPDEIISVLYKYIELAMQSVIRTRVVDRKILNKIILREDFSAPCELNGDTLSSTKRTPSAIKTNAVKVAAVRIINNAAQIGQPQPSTAP